MGAAIASLLMILASLGVSEGMAEYQRYKLNKNPSARDLQALASSIISVASSKGNRVLDKIREQVDSIIKPFGLSSAANEYLSKAKAAARKRLQQAQGLVDDVQASSAKLQGYVNTHEMLSDSGKNSSLGKTVRANAYKEMDSISDKASKLSAVETKL